MAEKTNGLSTNLSVNVAEALCYAPFLGWIACIVFLIVEKNSEVRWHAAQGLVLTVVLWALGFVLGMTIVLALLVPLVWVAGLVLQLVMVVKAYQGHPMRLPTVANWTDKIIKKV